MGGAPANVTAGVRFRADGTWGTDAKRLSTDMLCSLDGGSCSLEEVGLRLYASSLPEARELFRIFTDYARPQRDNGSLLEELVIAVD